MSGVAISAANPDPRVKSTLPPLSPPIFQSNRCTIVAIARGKTNKAREDPGQPLFPLPNGMYLKFCPFISIRWLPIFSWEPSKNLSGKNLSGSDHDSGSLMTAYALIKTRVLALISESLMLQSSKHSLMMIGADGWRRSVSLTIARR